MATEDVIQAVRAARAAAVEDPSSKKRKVTAEDGDYISPKEAKEGKGEVDEGPPSKKAKMDRQSKEEERAEDDEGSLEKEHEHHIAAMEEKCSIQQRAQQREPEAANAVAQAQQREQEAAHAGA
ncbi:MAG: hypothetical protein LQ342_005505 [Letrouitia transgressa]|nr:MAG: hypothetical protein LQ342_005505 [Letrouitia transgressa]